MSNKIKTLVSRGIALVHSIQGGPANKRPTALLMKSDVDPTKLTVEIVKSLEQVQLKISMEEFLRRFFYMYSSDAELLTKVLGFETEFEYNHKDETPDSEWEAKWIEEHQEYIDKKVESIEILKKANSGSELSLKEQYDLIELRKSFEKGCDDLGVEFVEESQEVSAEVKVEEVVEKSVKSKSSAGAPSKQTEESPVEITKSAEYLALKEQLEKQTEIMKAHGEKLKHAEEIIKAQVAAKRAVDIQKAKSFAFVEEAHVESVADALASEDHKSFVAVIEKAAEMLKAKEDELTAKAAEVEEIKKSFASGTPVGAEGELTPKATGVEDAQESLNRRIEAYKAAHASKQS